MNDPNPYRAATPEQINELEQKYAMADKELDGYIAALTAEIDRIAKIAELQAYSPSFMFDWTKAYMMRVLQQYPQPERKAQLLFMLATTAITRLVCAPHTKETDDILAQLEKGMNSDDR